MIKLLIISILLIFLYLGSAIIGQFDSKVTLEIYDYYVETTFFTVTILSFLFIIILFAFIKIIILILDLPERLKGFFIQRKRSNSNYNLIKSFAEYIMGNKQKAYEISRKISSDLNSEYKGFYKLINSVSVVDLERKIQCFVELEQFKQYAFFSQKNLAQIFINKENYDQAEFYASKAFNLDEFDSEILEILIECYGKLSAWKKFSFVVAKLEKLDQVKFHSLTTKIADYYLIASNEMLKLNDKKVALHYLEIADDIDPHNKKVTELIEALNQ